MTAPDQPTGHRFYPATVNSGGKVVCGEWLPAEGRVCCRPEHDPSHTEVPEQVRQPAQPTTFPVFYNLSGPAWHVRARLDELAGRYPDAAIEVSAIVHVTKALSAEEYDAQLQARADTVQEEYADDETEAPS